ncbi:hypothetical protein O7627_05150 [Solwaraspora sp. WMMD1047]|uniref:hypothetical protein n=1 Tax=Solwaraspora sp. WMMD1047 TaxID=3016102 RepID=UPI002416EB28|nr:hypothetical protein [Solwaraspora sp. WMMD1047]MDG4828693.1 hypothetical protein [Solwaraspora sp. WMMD1047]
MTRTGRSRARAALPPWMTAVLALTAVALLHGAQCASGVQAPLLASPTQQHVIAGVGGQGLNVVDGVRAGTDLAAPATASAGSGVRLETSDGAGHGESPCGLGLAAGACLVLLVSAAAGRLTSGRPGWSSAVADEVRSVIRLTRWRASPDLSQLCVLRT